MTKTNYFIALFMVIANAPVFSQTVTLDGFKRISKESITPIMERNEVKGYTLFYRIDKADRKNDNYGINIYDENLNEVKKIDIVKPRNSVFLISNSYNGQALALFFYDHKAKIFDIEVYDKSLKRTSSKPVTDISKMDRAVITRSMEAEASGEAFASYSLNLFPVPDKGFVKNGILEKNKGYSLTMFSNTLSQKWRYESSEKSKDYESYIIFDITADHIVGCIIRRSGMMSKKMDFYLGVFDVNTGKKILDQPIESGANEQLSLTGLDYDETNNEFQVVGNYYRPQDKPGVNKSMGFFIKKYAINGEEKFKRFYLWDHDVRTKMPTEALASVEKGYMNYTHKTIKGADSKTYMVVEQFKTAADAWGIAANVLNGGYSSSMTKGVIGNMMVFVLSPDMALEEIDFFAKDKSNVTLPPGSDFYGSGILAYFMRLYGGFDYQFSQLSNDKETFNAVYINYDKEKGVGTKKIIGNIILGENGEMTLDKVDVTSKATSSFLYPGKKGYLMMMDFLRKEKQLGLKLIKLNN